MSIGKKVAERMKKLGLTQMKLAQRTGMTQQAISNIVTEKSKPSYDAIVTLSRELEVTPAWFFELDAESSQESEEETLTEEGTPSGWRRESGTDDPGYRVGRPRPIQFVIGHYLPMRSLPHPIDAYPSGIATKHRSKKSSFFNFYFKKCSIDL